MKQGNFAVLILSAALLVGMPAAAQRGGRGGRPAGAAGPAVTPGGTMQRGEAREAQRSVPPGWVEPRAGGRSAIAERIERNPQLRERVQGMLPEGETIASAAAGFKNQGEFLASLEAARRLDAPFDKVKERVTAGRPLGEALRELRPDAPQARIKNVVREAKERAKQEK
jgi:hypothetical protein